MHPVNVSKINLYNKYGINLALQHLSTVVWDIVLSLKTLKISQRYKIKIIIRPLG